MPDNARGRRFYRFQVGVVGRDRACYMRLELFGQVHRMRDLVWRQGHGAIELLQLVFAGLLCHFPRACVAQILLIHIVLIL